MSLSHELAALFRRDLTQLVRQIAAFRTTSDLWIKPEGAGNSVGNLALHLNGNLREYIGRQLGNAAYIRYRDLEFEAMGDSIETLMGKIEPLPELICGIVSGLSSETLDSLYPENVLGIPLTTRQFLIHLLSHLNYHLGQIDAIRRIVTQGEAISSVGL